MTEFAPLVWSVPVCTVAYFTHRVAIRWLDAREAKNVRDEQRDERDTGVIAVLEGRIAKVEGTVANMKANGR